MINNRIFIELGFSILLIVGYFIYFIAKYRKKPNFLSSVLWGMGAFFVANAFSNLVNIGASYLISEGYLPNATFLIVVLSALSRIIGVVFSANFIFKMMKRSAKFDEKESPEIVGFMSGSGVLASPFNAGAHILALIQLLTNAIVINRNPTQEELGDIPIETLQEIKKIYETSPMFEFLSFAVYGIVIAFGFVMIYKMVAKYYNKENTLERFGVPFGFGFIYFVVIEGLPAIPVFPIVKIVFMIAFAGLAYVTLDRIILENEIE